MIRSSRFTIRNSRFTVHDSQFMVPGSRFTIHERERERGSTVMRRGKGRAMGEKMRYSKERGGTVTGKSMWTQAQEGWGGRQGR